MYQGGWRVSSSGWKTFWRKPKNIKDTLSDWVDAAKPEFGAQEKCAVPSLGCTVGIGHSHIMSLVYAQQARASSGQQPATHLHWILLQDEDLQPNLVPAGGRTVLNPVLRRRFDKEIASLPQVPPFLCASVSGNEYYYVGFTEHPRRFDFSLPERPDLQVRSGVEIIAPSLMRKTMERSMENALSTMAALRQATDLPIVFIQSPPPLANNDFIRENCGPFREAIQENGVSPASLRMKFWLLQSSIYRQKADELGCRYLEIPQEAMDSSGFLLETGSWPDSVHANAWYGEMVLQQIESAFSQAQTTEVSR